MLLFQPALFFMPTGLSQVYEQVNLLYPRYPCLPGGMLKAHQLELITEP